MRLSTKQLNLVIEAISLLYEPVGASGLPQHFLRSISIAFPNAVLTFDHFRRDSRSFQHSMLGASPSNHDRWLAPLPEVVYQNPVISAASVGAGPVLRLSELTSERLFLRSDFYQDIIKPLETRDQIGCILSYASGVLGLSINRKRISAEELRMAEILYPHLQRAFKNARSCLSTDALAHLTSASLLNAGLRLTPKEAAVLEWVLQGKRDSEIALILSNSQRTIEKHVQSILQKLGVETRTAAVLQTLECLGKASC